MQFPKVDFYWALSHAGIAPYDCNPQSKPPLPSDSDKLRLAPSNKGLRPAVFFELPAEIRNIIYDEMLWPIQFMEAIEKAAEHPVAVKFPNHPFHTLLVSKQFYIEAAGIWHEPILRLMKCKLDAYERALGELSPGNEIIETLHTNAVTMLAYPRATTIDKEKLQAFEAKEKKFHLNDQMVGFDRSPESLNTIITKGLRALRSGEFIEGEEGIKNGHVTSRNDVSAAQTIAEPSANLPM
jgi:hypothetical protein